jgi:hypothetical protein
MVPFYYTQLTILNNRSKALQMDTNTNPNTSDNLFDLAIDDTARSLLKTAATWAKIVAIVGLAGAALAVIEAFAGNRAAGSMTIASSVLIAIVTVVFSVILNIFLLRFASNIQSGLSGMNQANFNEGVNSLALYLKCMGIFIIVAISLAILFVLIFSAFMGMR